VRGAAAAFEPLSHASRRDALEFHGQALPIEPFGRRLGAPRAASVAAGYNFAAIITTSGDVWTFGLNDRFQCGHGDRYSVQTPRQVTRFAEVGAKVVQAACGQQHSVAVCADGRVFSWGLGVFGALGGGDLRDRPCPELVVVAHAQDRSNELQGHSSQPHHEHQAAAGVASANEDAHQDTRAPAVGEPSAARDSESGESGMARAFPGLACVKVSCGANHSVALTAGGEVFAWGHAEYAQTAAGDDGASGEARRVFTVPTAVPPAPPPGEDSLAVSRPGSTQRPNLLPGVVDIACGHLQTALILQDGGVATFGWGTAGMLGHGNMRYSVRPKRIEALAGGRVRSLALGSRHAVALLEPPPCSRHCRAPVQSIRRSLLSSALLADCALEASDGYCFPAHKAVLDAAWPWVTAALAFTERFAGRAAQAPLRMPAPSAALAKALEWAYTGDIARLALPLLKPLYALADRCRAPGLRAYASAWRVRHLEGRGDAIDVQGDRSTAPGTNPKGGVQGLGTPTGAANAVAADSWLGQCAGVLGACAHADLRIVLQHGSSAAHAEADTFFILAHRALLAAGSEYFRLLLAGRFDDRLGAAVDLSEYELEPEAAAYALRFAYCPDGSAGGIYTPAGDAASPAFCAEVLRASAAFCLDGLKQLAEATLVDHAVAAVEAAEVGTLAAASGECADGGTHGALLTGSGPGLTAVCGTGRRSSSPVMSRNSGSTTPPLVPAGALCEWLDSLRILADQHDAPRLSAACVALGLRAEQHI